jgi:hypothetical protein
MKEEELFSSMVDMSRNKIQETLITHVRITVVRHNVLATSTCNPSERHDVVLSTTSWYSLVIGFETRVRNDCSDIYHSFLRPLHTNTSIKP